MKKLIFAVLTVLLLLLFPACGKEDTAEGKPSRTVSLPFQAITEEKIWEFSGIMGFDGYCVDTPSCGSHVIRSYYGKTDDGMALIAETFGFAENSGDYILDFDGDGVTELIANVCYGGDGAERVRVWQLRNGNVELGCIDIKAYDSVGAIYLSISERFDPDRNTFVISFFTEEELTEKIICQWENLSHFTFEPYCGDTDNTGDTEQNKGGIVSLGSRQPEFKELKNRSGPNRIIDRTICRVGI